jgi:hypothetical protein
VKLEHAVGDTGERIHHIPLRYIQDAKPFSLHARTVRDLMDNKVWAGHNIVAFDIPVLMCEFDAMGMDRPRCAGVLDTMVVFSSMKYDQFTPNLKMDTIGKHFGLGSEVHDAYEDSLMTYRVVSMMGGSMVSSNLIIDPAILGKSPSIISQQHCNHQQQQGDAQQQRSIDPAPFAVSCMMAAAAASPASAISTQPKKSTPLSDINGIQVVAMTREEFANIEMRHLQNLQDPNGGRVLISRPEIALHPQDLPRGMAAEVMKAFVIGVLSENQIRAVSNCQPIFVHCAYIRADGFKQEYILHPKSFDQRYILCRDITTRQPMITLKQFKPDMFLWCRPVTVAGDLI